LEKRLQQLHVLLVEDDPEMLALLKSALEMRGHIVTACGDGESAWLAYQKRHYPLLILDWLLPGMDGLELCRKVRSHPSASASLVLVITVRTQPGDLEQVLAAGADDYLAKPVDLQLLGVRLTIAEQRVTRLREQAATLTSLRTQGEHLDEAQRIAHIGSWNLDLTCNKLSWSDEVFRIFELDPQAFDARYETFLNLVHPADRKQVNQAYSHSVESRTPYEIAHRLLLPDGRIKWLNERGETGYDDYGRALFSAGTVQDITACKRTEEDLQFSALVYHAVGSAVLITDSSDVIIAVNPTYTDLTGYSAEEVIGKNPRFQHSGRQDSAFYKSMWHKLNTTGIWEGEIWNRHKHGHDIAVWQLIHTSYDDNGNVLRRVALLSDVTDQKRAEETIRRHAYYDPLTGLPNRRLFHDRLDLEIRKARRSGMPMALMFIDLDNFKQVNDSLGHHQGDLLLTEAVRRITACVRETDTVSRLGGDEFTVIIPELDSRHSADRIAQKLIRTLAQPFQLGTEIAQISASIGITFFPDDATEMDALLNNADRAMYAAKHSGRNRYSHFTPGTQQAVS
jgi:diguanylate cyclase (GGDEF)-like protein/PAS domain S-box-containing protein